MTRNARKVLNDKITNGDNMTFQDAINMLMHQDSHDAFAQSIGYSDAAQMFHYENMAQAHAVSQQDGLLHELAKVDPREVYGDFEPADMSGVF